MPIIEIEIVSEKNETISGATVQQFADDFAEIFNVSKNRLWVKVNRIPSEMFAENGGTIEPNYPVFIKVLMAQWPKKKAMQKLSDNLSGNVSKTLNRPKSNIHVLFEPEGAGRIAFGGRLLDT